MGGGRLILKLIPTPYVHVRISLAKIQREKILCLHSRNATYSKSRANELTQFMSCTERELFQEGENKKRLFSYKLFAAPSNFRFTNLVASRFKTLQSSLHTIYSRRCRRCPRRVSVGPRFALPPLPLLVVRPIRREWLFSLPPSFSPPRSDKTLKLHLRSGIRQTWRISSPPHNACKEDA